MRLALAWSIFCFLRRAPLTVLIYAYRGALLAPAAFQTASERVKKVRRPQKQYNAKKETVNFRFFLFELLKMRLALAWSAFCFLRRAPLTVSIYAYRGALLAPAAFQTASERVKNYAF